MKTATGHFAALRISAPPHYPGRRCAPLVVANFWRPRARCLMTSESDRAPTRFSRPIVYYTTDGTGTVGNGGRTGTGTNGPRGARGITTHVPERSCRDPLIAVSAPEALAVGRAKVDRIRVYRLAAVAAFPGNGN